MEIESQLSDVQYQLENYTRQLRSMDQQVSYSTVDIYLREVATLTPTGVTFGERIADAFGGGWDAFVGFLQGLVIALVYLWPVLLIAVAVVFILRKVWKKRPKKEKLPKPAQTPPPAEYPVKRAEAEILTENTKPAQPRDMRLGRFLSLCAVGARHASPCTYPQKGILRAGAGPDMSGPYSAITSDLVLQLTEGSRPLPTKHPHTAVCRERS